MLKYLLASLILSILLLSSCAQEKIAEGGSMDPNSLNYDRYATYDDGSCFKGGNISISRRTSNASPNDTFWLWKDSLNGTGLKPSSKCPYFQIPTTPHLCSELGVSFNIGFGLKNSSAVRTWVFQFKKKLANGQVINLTPIDTIKVYNKYCDTMSIN